MVGLIGLSHQTALVEIREKLVISPESVSDLYDYLKGLCPITGIFALSTCNRTELYFEVRHAKESEATVMKMVQTAFLRYFSSGDELTKYLYTYSGIDTARHLFKVATGLDSLLLGEYQIVSQIKEAYARMNELNLLGPILSRMIQKAFETGKEVRTKTSINKGFVSVSSAAVDLTGKKLGAFSNINALSVGAGETGTIVVQNLAKKCCKSITIANRTIEKAINLANNISGTAISLAEVPETLEKVDVVLYTTGSPNILLSKEMMEPIMRNRNNKPLLVVDLCLPRNVDPSISEVSNVSLIDLDHLEEMVNANFEKRKGEIGKAEEIIDKAVADFDEWMGVRRLRCAISSITEKLKVVNIEEAGNYKKVKADQEVQKHIAEYGDHLSAKFTRMLIKQLREITNEGKDPDKIKVVHELFNFSNKN